MSNSALPLALYVHLPWCERKCPYCDFNSHEARGALPEEAYVDALLRDLDFELRDIGTLAQRPLASVFIGGGTPSLFSGIAIARLLEGVTSRFDLSPGCEITLEANPGSAEARRFRDYRQAGVNRLSIGIQSFRDSALTRIGRVHGSKDATDAVGLAIDAGFPNVNIDLMYALPGDEPDGAIADLERALAFGTSHISWYQLTLEPNTAFHRKPPPLPDEVIRGEIERDGRALLAAAGFERYEVSAYARDGHRSRHNLNYWEFGDYLGIGAGAHGKLTKQSGEIERRARTRNPRTYEDRSGTPAAVSTQAITDPDALTLEFLMNTLRLTDGVSTQMFEERTGLAATRLDDWRAAAEARGWMAQSRSQLRATSAGRELLNELLTLL